jgi:hypothetical protein
MKLFVKYITIIIILLTVLSINAGCWKPGQIVDLIEEINRIEESRSQQSLVGFFQDLDREEFAEIYTTIAIISALTVSDQTEEIVEDSKAQGNPTVTWVIRDEDGNEITDENGIVNQQIDEEDSQSALADAHVSEFMTFVGILPSATPEQIIESATAAPEDSITIADNQDQISGIPSEDQTDSGIGSGDKDKNDGQVADEPDDQIGLPGQPDVQSPDDQIEEQLPEDEPIGEEEEAHHEYDIFTYYEEDIMTSNDTKESITITVNIATGEVYGNHYFEGYIGEGYRNATYEFDTFLDSDNSFSVSSTATIYEDGQDIGEGTLTITGELNHDMAFIAGDIIDEIMGYGVMYYAPLITQSQEDPESEDF